MTQMSQPDMAEPGSQTGDLHATISELAVMIDTATVLAHRGEQVELDLLGMRVAVLCDAVTGANATEMQQFRPDLEDMLVHLDLLENTLRRQRVQLALNLESADRRLRAQMAYGRNSAGAGPGAAASGPGAGIGHAPLQPASSGTTED